MNEAGAMVAAAAPEGDPVMKPAEIVTAVVTLPVVAAFLVSAMADRAEPPAPAAITAEAPIDAQGATTLTIADEIVVEAKRPVA
jgi:hypothetical protein